MTDLDYFDEPLEAADEQAGRRGRKKRATAHRIFMSAMELMREHGFDGVSIEQICERAEIARATFFQHYASKYALMGVFSRIVHRRITAELEEAALPPTAQLELIVDHLQRLTNELGAIAPDMLSAFISDRMEASGSSHLNAGLIELLTGVIERGQAEGRFTRKAPAFDVALSLVSAWMGVARHHVSQGTVCDGRPLRGVLELFLNGLESR